MFWTSPIPPSPPFHPPTHTSATYPQGPTDCGSDLCSENSWLRIEECGDNKQRFEMHTDLCCLCDHTQDTQENGIRGKPLSHDPRHASPRLAVSVAMGHVVDKTIIVTEGPWQSTVAHLMVTRIEKAEKGPLAGFTAYIYSISQECPHGMNPSEE